MREEDKMSMAKRLTGGALALCLGLILPIGAFAAEKNKAPAPTPLTAAELYMIYADKTWTWNTGGGRFIGEDRRFVAW